MKTITLILILISTVMTSQIVPYVKGSVDPKMLIQGAHPDNDEYSDSSLDYELQFGLEFNSFRVSTAYQSHKEINYSKYTFLMVDYMLKDFPLKNINCYAGVEWSSIFRTDLPGWRKDQSSMWHWGFNAEIQYMPFDNIGISSHINMFRAEPELTKYGKYVRYEVMIGIVLKLNKI